QAGIGTLAAPLRFAAGSLVTRTYNGNGDQFLAATGTVTLGTGDLQAGHGRVVLTSGTFQAQADDVLGPDTSLELQGATFDIGRSQQDIGVFSQTVPIFSLVDGIVTGADGVLTLDVDAD